MFSGTGGVASTDLMAPPVRYRRSDPATRNTIWLLAAASGAAALLASGEPTGLTVVDAAWRVGFAVVVTLAASRARRWPAVWMAGLATAFAGGIALPLALGSFVAAGAGVFSSTRNRLLGAVTGALAVQALLRLPDFGFHGASALVSAVAVAPVLYSGYNRAHAATRQLVRRGVIIGGACLLAAVAGLALAMTAAFPDLRTGVTSTRDGHEALEQAELGQAANQFNKATKAFAKAETALGSPWAQPARVIPLLGQHHDVVADTSREGRRLTRSAADTARVAPYQELHAAAGEVDLEAVQSMQTPVARSVTALEEASAALNQEHSPWLAPPLANQLDLFADELDDAIPEAKLAAEALELAPALLGADGPRHYLVLFTSPAETRFLGGFSGAYGELDAIDGKVTFGKSGNISELSRAGEPAQRTISPFDGSEEYEARYARFFPQRFFQNLTVSPDLPTDAIVTRDLYGQATGRDIDGVIVADPYALAGFLELTGPVAVDGIPQEMTADNVLDYLLFDQYIQFEGDNEARRESLGAVADATFDALTTRDLPGPATVGAALAGAVAEKHLMVWMFDETDQQLFDSMSAGGQFRPGDQDFVSLRTANASPNKIDTFLQRTLDYEVEFDPTTGATEANAHIRLENSAPTRLPDYVIGNASGAPPGTNVLYLSFYSPLQLEAVSSAGNPIPTSTHRELGTNVYSMEIRVPSKDAVTIDLRLAGVLEPSATYELHASRQPTVNADRMSITIRSGAPGWETRPTADLDHDGSSVAWTGVLRQDRTWVAEFAPLP
jgi:hypothetical protein